MEQLVIIFLMINIIILNYIDGGPEGTLGHKNGIASKTWEKQQIIQVIEFLSDKPAKKIVLISRFRALKNAIKKLVWFIKCYSILGHFSW